MFSSASHRHNLQHPPSNSSNHSNSHFTHCHRVPPSLTMESKFEITEQEVLDVQKGWGEGIVKIGKVFSEKGDYVTAAKEHIDEFYNYQDGTVLFKPTLASEIQFRPTFVSALSYFVGGNEDFPEDKGFAIKPWSAVRWEGVGIKIIGNMAVAMGNYFFTPAAGGDDVKVEYSFGYSKNADGKLKIILHGSHVPYSP
eukprot:GFKZ01002540.1.p1 GENE.GFKZ01002540.1~~GFKZ01002540.1.p1  ORF type:complete len:197 (-),score=30.39 GFKZ01002540.1:283-873(-)